MEHYTCGTFLPVCLDYTKIVECLQVGLQILKPPVDLNVPYCCETQK